MEEIEQEMLSDEPGLKYVHELQYSNGAVYRGQIKSVEKLRQERASEGVNISASGAKDNDLQGGIAPSDSRNSYISNSVNEVSADLGH